MAYLATFFIIWLVIAVVVAVPVGKALHKLGRDDVDFEAEHEIWASGEIFRDMMASSPASIENIAEYSVKESVAAA